MHESCQRARFARSIARCTLFSEYIMSEGRSFSFCAAFTFRIFCFSHIQVTTNLGATFGALGMRTLLIDCDQQCNTTAFFFPDAPAANLCPQVPNGPAGNDPEEDVAVQEDVAVSPESLVPVDGCPLPNAHNEPIELRIIFQQKPFGEDVDTIHDALAPAMIGEFDNIAAARVRMDLIFVGRFPQKCLLSLLVHLLCTFFENCVNAGSSSNYPPIFFVDSN